MEENGILNVYKFNLYQFLNFMFRVHNQTIPKSFQTKFQYIEHKYETRQSKDNFIIPKRNTRITLFWQNKTYWNFTKFYKKLLQVSLKSICLAKEFFLANPFIGVFLRNITTSFTIYLAKYHSISFINCQLAAAT